MAAKEKKVGKIKLLSSRSQRVMLICVIIGVIICAGLFSMFGVLMTKKSSDTIDYVGTMNMRDTGYQIVQRFQTVMDQRIKMVEGLDKEHEEEYEGIRDDLKKSAQIRGFKYLAYYYVDEQDIENDEKGSVVDAILGNKIEVTDKTPFRTSVLHNKEKIAVGKGFADDVSASNGEDIVLLSVPSQKYTMSNGKKSMALVAGITNEDFIKMLDINADTDAEKSVALIVRKDELENGGRNSFVLKREQDGAYKCLSDFFADKLSGADVAPEDLVSELNDVMHSDGEDYASILHKSGHHISVYCNKLAKSEWYLVALMSNANLNRVIDNLSNQWALMITIAIIIVFAILIAIFLLYNYYNKQNVAQLENARAEALEASKAKSEFLSNMSHDIRTPMNAIVGMTAIARANLDDGARVQDCLKKIALSSKHLLGLINDVLDMSKIESGKMTLNIEQISLKEMLESITTIVQPQVKIKKQHFNVIVNNIIQETVYSDSVRLNQVLLNLLSNAIKFTGDEGTIELSLSQQESHLGYNYVRTIIRVKDNGIGMTPEFQAKIYEAFVREDNMRVHRTEGTGLGMSITKYIVDAMNGTIELKSELGKGTEFTVTLDFERATIAEEDMRLPDWRMLIVDDDQQLCESTVSALKDLGVTSDWTLDGESAVDKTVEAENRKKAYDIIILDWKLPGIDGIETAKQIRKRLNGVHVPILLSSAYDWNEIEDEARAAGISGFISKPLFKSTLYYGLKDFVAADDVPANKEKEAHNKIDLKGKHILLAEDNDLNWEIAEMLLGSAGIECDHAENGQICVDMFKNSEPGKYNAILMDIRMPVMNGYEATQEIRKLDRPDKDLPIIAMTADAFSEDIQRCLDSGMNAHIAKPIDLDVVQNTLEKFIK